jgi:hypothetical protein
MAVAVPVVTNTTMTNVTISGSVMTMEWADANNNTHTQMIDLNSDFGGMLVVLAKAMVAGKIT